MKKGWFVTDKDEFIEIDLANSINSNFILEENFIARSPSPNLKIHFLWSTQRQ